MNDCNAVETLFEEYFHGELSPAEDLLLQKHLHACPQCRQKIAVDYTVHARLKTYRRPTPPPRLVPRYYEKISQVTGHEKLPEKLKFLSRNIVNRRSPLISFARVAILLGLGILLGRALFTSPEPEPVIQTDMPYAITRDLSKADIDYVYYYLVTSEIFLLEYYNQTEQPNFYLDRELARKLLIKTFRVHEIGLRLNDLRILRFVGRMEILLHEASNLKDDEVDDFLDTVRMVVGETDLLREVSNLQLIYKKRKDQFG
ncbi:MAG: zf-HC2 domain-containing protein, partial [Calditrichales bacterium]